MLDASAGNAELLRSEFRTRIQQLGLVALREHDGAPCELSGCERAIVLGVATWSSPDLEALDTLVAEVKGLALLVFDLDACRDAARLQALMPGCSLPLQSPVLATYSRGELLISLEGERATAWIVQGKWQSPSAWDEE